MTVTPPPSACLATGIAWRSGEPFLRLVDDRDAARRQPLRLGEAVGWRVHGPRRCTGVWLPEIGERRPCPNLNTVPATTATSQCAACAAADPGRAVARNFAVDDPRPFAIYLAWFGPGLVKIGLTAVERDTDRLAEQGALAFTWLARGPFRTARRLEHHAASIGAAQERIPRSRRLPAWWRPPPITRASHDELAAVHHDLTTDVSWPSGLDPAPFGIHDLTGLFGLGGHLPPSSGEVTGLADGAVLAGRLHVLAGHDALLDTPDGHLAVDLRLLSGWAITPTDEPADGLTTTPSTPVDEHEQGTLF